MSSRRRPLQPNAALAQMMAADREREGEPFGGFAGERAAPPVRSATALPRPVIPPPPWAEGGEPDPLAESAT